MSTHYEDFPNSDTYGDVEKRTLRFVVKKQQNKRLILIIYHHYDNYIKLKINNQNYKLTPSEIVHCEDFQTMIKKKKIGPGDRFELEYKKRSVVLTKEGRFIHEILVKYPLKIEISGGEMMMSRMEIQ